MAQESNPDQKRTARKHFHDAQYLGTDGEGADHWWSIYHQSLVIFGSDGDAVETVKLAETPFSTLKGWTEYTKDERGEWQTLKVSRSMARTVANSMAG